MRWEDGRRSDNVDDQRGAPGPRMAGAGPLILLRFLPMLVRTRIGRYLLGFAVLAYVGARLVGIDPGAMLQGGPTVTQVPSGEYTPDAAEQQLADFVSVVLADTEDTWRTEFQGMGRTYEEPHLVMFTGAVRSACGNAQSAMGPFYCPADHKVYIDLSFYDDLKRRHGAPGDFAQAYVIAHEVGHHVQTLLGISQKVQQAGRGASEAEVNQLSVRQELQADCFAGLWGNHANRERQVLEPGDLEEALTAASAIGDDRLQKQTQGHVVPDSFTHGSSEQRMRWFRKGFESGDLAACDTFAAKVL